jgi:hypothetical protein
MEFSLASTASGHLLHIFFSLREEPLALKKSAKSNLNLIAPKKKIGHSMGFKD